MVYCPSSGPLWNLQSQCALLHTQRARIKMSQFALVSNFCASSQDTIFTTPYFIFLSRQHGGFLWESSYGTYYYYWYFSVGFLLYFAIADHVVCGGKSVRYTRPALCHFVLRPPFPSSFPWHLPTSQACCWFPSAGALVIFLTWGFSLASFPSLDFLVPAS